MKNEIVFTVNSLGEQIDHVSDGVLGGSVRVSDLPEDPWERAQYWMYEAAQDLTFQQYLVYAKWSEANEAVAESSLYRFYGHLMADGTKHLWLSVEFFIYDDEDREANERLMREFVAKWGLGEEVMAEGDIDGDDYTQYICDIDVWNMPIDEIRRRAIMMRREIRVNRDTLGEIVNNVT